MQPALGIIGQGLVPSLLGASWVLASQASEGLVQPSMSTSVAMTQGSSLRQPDNRMGSTLGLWLCPGPVLGEGGAPAEKGAPHSLCPHHLLMWLACSVGSVPTAKNPFPLS